MRIVVAQGYKGFSLLKSQLLFFRNNSMKWTVEHDLTLCGEVLLQEPFKHPKNSKDKGEIWSNVAVNLNSLENPSFSVKEISQRQTYFIADQVQGKNKGRRKSIWHKLWRDSARCSNWRDSWEGKGSWHVKKWAKWYPNLKGTKRERECWRG